ncbi:MAG: hypothetical protein WDA16_14980 [Candidatus Thermoplasmatota archaeon]
MAISVLLWAFRFAHILSGVAWVGGAFIWSMVVAPRLLARGPAPIRRPVLEALIDAVPRYFLVSGGMTVLFGVLLLGQLHGWGSFFATLQKGTYGAMLGIGFILALVMLALGAWVVTPTAKKLLGIMQSLPPGEPTAEAQARLGVLGKRMAMAGMTTALLGTIALAAMTWAVTNGV